MLRCTDCKIVLGDGEVGVDRIQALDNQQGAAVSRHDVAEVDEPLPGPAVDGRANRAVVEVETSVLNRGLILFDLGFGYLNARSSLRRGLAEKRLSDP